MGGPIVLPALEASLGALPLFPLPQVVLFPGALLPLHVFEPRYVAMVKDVLASHRTMAVVQLVEPSEAADDQAAIARVAGAGTIVDHDELPGGRYHIVLVGRGRVALEELPFAPPYRRARAAVLDSDETLVAASDVAAMHAAATAFAVTLPEPARRLPGRFPQGLAPGRLCDAYAATLLLDGRDKQRVLETADTRARVRCVTEILTHQRVGLLGPGPSNELN